MKRWAVWSAIAAAGVALLAYLAPRAHPAVQWRVYRNGEQSQERSREISAAFGVDTQGWAGTVTGDTDNRAGYFAEHHPEMPEARRFSPLEARVALKAPSGAGRLLVSISTAGDVNSWQWTGYPKSNATDPAAARALAAGALDRLMGKDAAAFRPSADRSPNGDNHTFVFERTAPLNERFEATVDSGRVVKAEVTASYPHDVDEALNERKKYINWLQGGVGIGIDFVGTALAAGVYVFWAVRRAVRHRFVLAFSATSILWGAVYWSNWMGYDQRYDSVANNTSLLGNFFGAVLVQVLLILLLVILAGATDAVGSPPKLVTLRSVFSASILNRPAGSSVLAGFLCGPLLAAMPLAVSWLRLPGSQQTGDYEASLIFAAHPGVQALDVMVDIALLGLFGFGAAFLGRHVRNKWLATVLLTAPGILLLSTAALPSETAPAAFLLSGALLFLAYHAIFLRLDLLAVLSAGWCARVLWNGSALMLQPAPSLRSSGTEACLFLAVCAGCAALVAWRGGELPVEDGAAPAVVTSQRESLMKEFSIAHRVQQHMLPSRPPEIPSCSLSASCHPAQEVGGDLFDFLRLPDGRWSIGVGDVSGKGVPAALYMTLTKGLLAATTQDSSDLLEIVGNVNSHVHAATEKKTFVTLAMGAFDPETLRFDHVRAGHNPIVWRRPAPDETSLLNAPGIGLGIVSDRLFRRSLKLDRLQLSAGDALVFYSDGVTEAMNAEQEQFGEARLMRAVEAADGLDAGAVREGILQGVREFLNGIAPQDDMTVVVLRVN
ncbi:MAG: PP2C family protein-serine/threonine phosphatase [Candidatus Sulfopaludibacter sp.]|nr:PP2C family protein-serine/threonine phosphatase [Candidatus Sulfopaludibacter sp.]